VQLTFDHKQHSEKGQENKKQQCGPEKPKKKKSKQKHVKNLNKHKGHVSFFGVIHTGI